MNSLSQSGSFDIDQDTLARIVSSFEVGSSNEEETVRAIRSAHARSGYLPDPHTGVGLHVARKFLSGSSPMITLATAHPAKFPDALESATGILPQLPPGLEDIHDRTEKYEVLPNDPQLIQKYIRRHVSA